MEFGENGLPPLPYDIIVRPVKKGSKILTGYLIHYEVPRFKCEYSANEAPKNYSGLLLQVSEYNIYLFNWQLLDGNHLEVEYSEIFSKMLDAARALDGIIFLKFPDDRSRI